MSNTVDKVIKVAEKEVGYLEKSKVAYQKDKSVLDEHTRGAGSDNYTKYGRDMHKIYPAVMDFPAPWCDAFVDWCFYKAYGVATAKSLLGGNFDDYTVASCQMYKNKNALNTTPTKGSQVFFTKNGQVSGCYHTGLVYAVDNTDFYSFEGNTSGASGVIANGGGVAKKKYSIAAYKGKTLFGHPKYDTDTVKSTTKTTSTKKSIDVVAKEIINGSWGNGTDRTKKLSNAGYTASEIKSIQDKVNEILTGKTTTASTSKTETKSNTSNSTTTKKSLKIEPAASHSKTIAGSYKTTSNLNLRVGAGTNKDIITTIPKGSSVTCYGYYTSVSGTKWYYITYKSNTGFVSSDYLTKKA